MEENRTILIVDDEPETLKGYVEFLTAKAPAEPRKSSRRSTSSESSDPPPLLSVNEKYNILTAPSGEKAIEIAKAEIAAGRRIAAGFFDVKLEGGIDGLATIQAIKTLDKDIHCVVVTAYHDRSVEEIHKLFGEEFKDQWDYLNKPFTQGEIVQKARQMTAAWNRRRKITELHDQLVRAERHAAIGQVARGVGHEFGNILLRIVGKTDLALMEKDVKKIHDHLNVVMQASERASMIVKNLQSFSRTEPQKRKASITEAIDEPAVLVNHELVKASVKLVKDYKSTPLIQIDAGAMGQVFLNLLINAVHAMPQGGQITVSVDRAQGDGGKPGVLARVSDTGTGIPAETLPRIFDYAFTTKGDRGSGLGLSISRDIVEAHGGKISVSTQIGKGTEFSIWVPE